MLYIKGKMKVKRSAEDIMTLLKQGSEFSYKRKFSKRTFGFFIPAEARFWKNLDYCYVYGRLRKHQDHCEVSYTILPGIKLLVACISMAVMDIFLMIFVIVDLIKDGYLISAYASCLPIAAIGIWLFVVLFFDAGDQNVCKYKLEELLINGYNPKYFGRYSD